MSERPDWICCITQTRPDYVAKAWCGKPVAFGEWAFVNIDHAAYTSQKGERLVPCPECVAAVVKALKSNA